MTDKPFLSVIIPLPDHRGHAVEAIKSWTQQNCPRGDYEIVVIIDGREPELERTVGALLSPGDRLVRCEDGSLHDCYNEGARVARGQVLLFTESHVKAESDCVAEIIARFARGDVDGLAVASGGINESHFAAQEQTIYEEALPDRIAGGWNLCTVRGCAIERHAFHRAGGFRSDYGHFSEILLGATLKCNGARLRYADRARVWHFNSGDFGHFGRELTRYGGDEIRFRAENPASPLLRFLGPSGVWDSRHSWVQSSAMHRFGNLLWAAAKDLVRGRIRGVCRTLAKASSDLPASLFGPSWLTLKADLFVAYTAMLLLVTKWSDRVGWTDAAYYRAFRTMWVAQINRGRTHEVARQLALVANERHGSVEPPVHLAKAA